MLIVVYHMLIHPLITKANIEFLPLLINSVWAACFNLVWVGYLYYRFMHENMVKSEVTDEEKYWQGEWGRVSHVRKSSHP